jgi:5-methylcytosine-specific restriction endonuclease McrA
VTGCGGCLGRLVLLGLLAWSIGGLAKAFGWSDAVTGSFFLAVLGLLAIGGSRRGRTPATTRATSLALAPSVIRRHARTIRSGRGWHGPRSPHPPRRGRTSTRDRVHRARDPLPAQLRFRILQRDDFRCGYCGRPGSAPGVVLHVDHVVPLAAGGATDEGNLLTACEECNLGKATRAVVPVGP